MPIVDESKQNKGVNNNTQNRQMAIKAEELYTQLQKHPRIYDLMVAMDNYNGFKAKQIGR